MRGQCGIAVVAATLVTTGKSIHSTSTARDAVLAPRVLCTIPTNLRRKGSASGAAAAAAVATAAPLPAIEGSSEGKAAPSPDGIEAGGSDGDWATPEQARSTRQSSPSSPADATSCSSSSQSSSSPPSSRLTRPVESTRQGAHRRPRTRGAFAALPAFANEERASADRPRNAAAATTVIPASMKAVLATRGGGAGAWFAGRGGNGAGGSRGNDPYNEFPDDFDYDAEEEEHVEGTGLFWPDEESVSEEGAAEAAEEDSLGRDLEQLGEEEEEEAGGQEGEEGRWRTDRLSSVGFRKDRGGGGGGGGGRGGRSSAEGYTSELGRSSAGAAKTTKSSPPSSSSSSSALIDAPGRGVESDTQRSTPSSIVGAVLGALAGAVGLKIWEGFLHHRGGGGGEGEGDVDEEGSGAGTEEGLGDQQTKIQTLEDQLAYLEEDRRRMAAAAKEARAARRKDDRQLKEYVHTLEVHLDQLSKEKQESETTMVESVKVETAKALEQAQEGHQAAAVAAEEEACRLRDDLEATKALLESAVRERAVAEQEKAAAEQEKAAADALLRTEQGRGAALERDAEKLGESTAELTQRLLDAGAKAERAGEKERKALEALAGAEKNAKVSAEEAVAAAREEEAARCRREMEAALAEEKERLRKQMEARLTTMRAGLKRRLQEARAERAGTAGTTAPGRTTSSAANAKSSPPPQ